jgi:hypothetical protein
VKGILKFVLLILLGVILLFGCLYFFVTSQYFLQNFILPELENSINGSVEAEKITFSPFSCELNVVNLKVDSPDKFSLKVGRADMDFNLTQLLFKRVELKYFNLNDTYIKIIQKRDRFVQKDFEQESNNVHSGESVSKRTDNENPLKNIKISLNKIKIKNLNLEYVIKRKTKNESTDIRFLNFNLDIPYIKTDAVSTGKFNGDMLFSSINDKNKLPGKFNGELKLNLSKTNFPTLFNGNANLSFYKYPNSKVALQLIPGKSQDHANAQCLLTVENLPTLPFLKTFVKGSYNESDGILKRLDVKLENNDLAALDAANEVNGELQMSLENFSIPIELKEFEIIKMFFLPIDIMANIDNYTNSRAALPVYLKKIFAYADDVIDGLSTLKFSSSNINLSYKKGIVYFDDFTLNGEKAKPFNRLKLSGTAGIDKKINLKTKTTINGVEIPLDIKGTTRRPKPVMNTFISDLLSNNLESVNSNKSNALKKAGEDTAEQLKDSVNKIIQDEKNYTSSSEDSKAELKNNVDNISNSLNSFLSNAK